MYLNKMHFFAVSGAMLNIVQDSALLEAIGCQMEMVSHIPHVICQRSTSDFNFIPRHLFLNSAY